WRLSDVDGTAKVAHTGTLSGMYSAVTLLPELDVGFVILVNGSADEARTVLEQTLSRHFTAPADARTIAHYAKALATDRTPAPSTAPVGAATAAIASPRLPVTAESLAPWLGRYRDPWFGEATVCEAEEGEGVRFASAKSPRLSGPVLRADGRLLVDFDTLGPDADAWLDFSPGADGAAPRLAMAKVDPEADFSYDYEDLAFERIAVCPEN